jgi:hypothetical protein
MGRPPHLHNNKPPAERLLHYTLSSLRPHAYFVLYVCAGRVCISVCWVKLYQWLTGEQRLEPLLNLAITFWVPVLVKNWWRRVEVGGSIAVET